MRVLAPAKINLHLRVGARTADGYHPLVSWMCFVGLFDTLEISARASTGPIIELTCDDPALPTDSRNLVVRAAEALIKLGDVSPVTIHLSKRIPSGGGLGGGSSDAARTLLALSQFWKLNPTLEQLHAIALSLGSDVPFFLYAPSSVCTGRGEVMHPIALPTPRACLLILPRFSCATADVYRKFDKLNPNAPPVADDEWHGCYDWLKLPAVEFLSKLSNDLEPAAYEIQPDLRSLRENAEKLLNRPVRMTGSGSTLFTLFDDDDSARIAAAQIEHGLHVKAIFTHLGAPREIEDDLCRPAAGHEI